LINAAKDEYFSRRREKLIIKGGLSVEEKPHECLAIEGTLGENREKNKGRGRGQGRILRRYLKKGLLLRSRIESSIGERKKGAWVRRNSQLKGHPQL